MLNAAYVSYNDIFDIAACILTPQEGEFITERVSIPLDITTSIPAKPGMSGGSVYRPRDGVTIGACGIVCADNSPEESHHDFLQCGDSVIACAWPTLSLRFPLMVPSPADAPTHTLFEMVHRGLLPPPLGGIEAPAFRACG